LLDDCATVASKIFLDLGAGSLGDGFDRVTCRLVRNSQEISRLCGSLPANLFLQSLFQQWQVGYAGHYESRNFELRGGPPEFEIDDTGTTGYSQTNFQQVCAKLEVCMGQWLSSTAFQLIENELRTHLFPNEDVAIIIAAEDSCIYGLPWHYWSLLGDFKRAEVAFCLSQHQGRPAQVRRQRPRILAVFGDGQGLNVADENERLRKLKADIVFLSQPSGEALERQLNDGQGWDMLFFAGHSGNELVPHLSPLPQGAIRLNDRESITLKELKHSLDRAIERGLQVAIFNSCSGLGLAASLADLNIPVVIVMREAVPDQVAHKFWQVFLQSFAGGQSLLYGVREARQSLQILERGFPCASWLPVVFCNPLVEAPLWQNWSAKVEINWWRLVMMAAIVTGAVWGLRAQGWLEGLELGAYDWVMRHRLVQEAPESRLTIVGVDEQDFGYLQARGWSDQESIGDRGLVKLLEKLQSYSPKVIGLDIYRNGSVAGAEGERDRQRLLELLQQENMIAACLMPDQDGVNPKLPGEAALSGLGIARVGFTNFVIDGDGVIRRQLLGMAPVNRDCASDHALSLRLALGFLGAGEATETAGGKVRIGSKDVAVLPREVGSYRSVVAQENMQGFQVFLNYRHGAEVARQVSVTEVLENRADPALFKNKVVLIGYVACRKGDDFAAIEGGKMLCSNSPRMLGVELHAQMTSNILSHVLDGRPLLWTWPDGWEMLWIGGWGVMGGLLFFGLRNGHVYGCWLGVVSMGAGLFVIYGFCFNIWFVWLPLVPAELSLLLTPVTLWGGEKLFEWREKRP
jgi:CHASE2 domain-containing sensor protein